MKTVFVALSQFSHYSDVLRTGCIGELATKFRVVVLTPTISDDVVLRDHYPSSEHILYRKIDLTYPRTWNIFDKYIRVPLVRRFDHLTYMRYFYQRPHWWPRKLLMKLRIFFPRSLFTTDRITRWEMRWAKPSELFSRLIEAYQPVCLVTATPGFTQFEAELILFARRCSMKTVAININYDNLTSNGKLIRKTDFLATWNERMSEEARLLHGFAPGQLRITGCLRFDHYFKDQSRVAFPSREAFLQSKGLDPMKKTIVHAGPTPANYPPRVEFVRELVRLKQQGKLSGDPNILIRIHPNDPLNIYDEVANISGVHIERAGRQTRSDAAGGQKIEMGEEDLINLTATLAYADVVLNFASTVIIEACVFSRPVINIGFPEHRRIVYQYEYNKGLLDTGAVRLARDLEELEKFINLYLTTPTRDQDKREALIREYVPFRDGKTGERTLQFLEDIMGEA